MSIKGILKHKNNTDVALKVLKELEDENGCVRFQGLWVNIASNPPFQMWAQKGPLIEIVNIKYDDYDNWVYFETAEDARNSVQWGKVKHLD